METTEKKRIFLVRNGISLSFTALLLIAAGILFTVKIADFSYIEIIRTGGDGGYIGIILKETKTTDQLTIGDIFSFEFGDDEYRFNIDSITIAENSRILFLSPLSSLHDQLPSSLHIAYKKHYTKLWHILFRD